MPTSIRGAGGYPWLGHVPSTRELIVAQTCDENGHACRCTFEDLDDWTTQQMSSNCCVHGETDCTDRETEK